MSGKSGRTDLQGLYGLLPGGLISSFIGMTVFSVTQEPRLAVSFGSEPRWVAPVTLAVAIAVGITIGWRRFGRVEKPVQVDGEEA